MQYDNFIVCLLQAFFLIKGVVFVLLRGFENDQCSVGCFMKGLETLLTNNLFTLALIFFEVGTKMFRKHYMVQWLL